MSNYIFVYVTCESREQAFGIAAVLVENRLAACANLMAPIASIYNWEGETRESEEFPLIIKTRKELFPNVEEAIKDMHSYDNPCIVSLPLEQGSQAFFSWIEENTIKP